MYTMQHVSHMDKRGKEAIHSGQFMVSHFEAEEQDDEDNLAIPIPEVTDIKAETRVESSSRSGMLELLKNRNNQQLAIDTSLSKLFKCMSLAYRQKLTSPKWNRFRGIRLRWKDKIRLNNVIWRCWHLQFIKKENTLVCQFASPLDVDTHNKPEAVVLEGKYWKRKLAAVTAEYKKWRMFYRNHALGHAAKESSEMLSDVELLVWDSNSSDNMHMMVDEDYMGLMSDTLFSTITNQTYPFPDTRELAKAGLADFIQPSLGPLQPNLDDYMDTFDPLQDFISHKLPTVPEEQAQHNPYKQNEWGYLVEIPGVNNTNLQTINPQQLQYQSLQTVEPLPIEHKTTITGTRNTIPQTNYNESMVQPVNDYSSYQSQMLTKSVPSKTKPKISSNLQNVTTYVGKAEDMYQNYSSNTLPTNSMILHNEQMQMSVQEQSHQVNEFKLPQAQTSQDHRISQGYKFYPPAPPQVKFTSQQSKVEKQEPRRKGATRGRRSRSNTREPIKRPPLISAVSDPQLITPQNSVLLTQLLTNNSDSPAVVYNRSHSMGSSPDLSSTLVKKEPNSLPILQKSPQHELSTMPNKINQVTIQQLDPLSLNTFSNSNSPITDNASQSLNSPTSSQSSLGSPNRDGFRDRRVGHIHAEQKRRCNIKNGFDMLHSLIPHLNQNPNAKLAKAAMLQKGAEYIRQLRLERNQLEEEMDSLRQQIESLNTSISNCQSMLPATGAPVSRRQDSKMQEMFEEYIKNKTMENWKYWIFSLIFRPLLNSFNNFVSTSSLDDLYSSTILWIEQHCTLVDLRPVVLNSLKYLCAKTEILLEPEKLPDEARRMVHPN